MAADQQRIIDAVRLADQLGFDLVGIQDHPYQRRFFETWTLLTYLAALTTRIRFFPDVANLPLRPPAVLAKAAASLDLLSDGRCELGLGAGGFWDAIEAMGGPRRTPAESVDALEEAIAIIRLMWSGQPSISYTGRHYSVRGLHPGPAPAHPIGIWVGAYRPRMLRLIGRLADGWVPSLGYVQPDALPAMNALIDETAGVAGRDPKEIRRILNVGGVITDGERGDGILDGPPGQWIEVLGRCREAGMDTFIFWSEDREQIERFAQAIVPALGKRTG
ncbi:MAG TPA: LLM class flavin-dependent oxidoreductase [Candidatus Dormibacteraeota bacterium]|nr:LLM class flavin-dependent oxidoreductase [Candidatus Dormibacteraeota bacterium]